MASQTLETPSTILRGAERRETLAALRRVRREAFEFARHMLDARNAPADKARAVLSSLAAQHDHFAREARSGDLDGIARHYATNYGYAEHFNQHCRMNGWQG